MRAGPLALVALMALPGCELNFPKARPPTVSLRMQGAPLEASVTIDDEYVGPLSVVMAGTRSAKPRRTSSASTCASCRSPIDSRETPRA
jgi:hypothetical protein